MSYGNPFQARYGNSLCADCKKPIEAGQMVRYRYPEKALTHQTCEEIEPTPYRVTGGSGNGCQGWNKGQVIKVNPERYDGHEFLFVVMAQSRYFREDGLSFGVGDDQGHLYTAHCRPATKEEAAPVRQQTGERKQKLKAKARVIEISRMIQSEGERPEGPVSPEGDRLFDSQNIHGGGTWFVIGADHIWFIRNNGADGDDWRVNNVRTGGAGAIGWRVDFDVALAEELRTLSTI